MKRKKSIKIKLIIITSLIVLISMAILSVVFYLRATDFLNQDVDMMEQFLLTASYTEGSLLVNISREKVQSWLMRKYEFVRQFSTTPILRDKLKEIPPTTDPVKKVTNPSYQALIDFINKMYNYNYNNLGFTNVFVGSELTQEIYSYQRTVPIEEYNLPELNWYKLGKTLQPQEAAFTNPYQDDTLFGVILIAVVSPIVDKTNKIIGIAGVHANFSFLQELINETELSENGVSFVIDQNNKFTAHKNVSYTQDRLSLTDVGDEGYLQIKRELERRKENEDKTTFYFETDIEGKNQIVFVSYVPGVNWWLGITIPKAEIIADAEKMRQDMKKKILALFWFILGIALAALIISGLIIYYYSSKVTKPIFHLMTTMRKIEEGNLRVQAEIESKDEIGVMANVFNGMVSTIAEKTHEINEMNANLEKLVEQRTEELHKSYKEVSKLKVQQDGDYFLTSQLIRPLITNSIESSSIKVDFYISQKKKFQFKQWSSEIGGDLCIAHSLILNHSKEQREYTVFVNGDAMGKSLQGAGGSLVFGVIFNAFVNRTKFVSGMSNLSPEEWLVKCFRELQDVFGSFDGSMLISVVMGIIDDQAGTMYYFNAEHPWTVIYRKNKASFIEQELENRKIGTTYGMSRVKIKILHLKPKDILIAGSDGRDDIIINYDEETGMRIINEDEELFLKAVENGQGQLEAIAENIKNMGEITDDLSLLRISYRADETEITGDDLPPDFEAYKLEGTKAYEEERYEDAIKNFEEAIKLYTDLECYIKLINALIRQENYTRALYIVEKAIKEYPGDLNIIYSSAILHKKNKEYDEALYYARRYFIHKSEDFKILVTLADLYRIKRDRANFKIYLKKAEELNPYHPSVNKLKSIIQ